MKNYSEDVFVWVEETHSVGKEEFDNHHKVIFDLINEMQAHQNQEQFKLEFRDLITRSIDYFNFHLKKEQEWLAEVNYPDYEEHCELHKQYILGISKFFLDFTQNKTPDISKFIQFQKQWWTDHICNEDMKYKSYAQ
jgi:hemerythrin-like metal-binding protein